MKKRERERAARAMTKAERVAARTLEERELASKLASLLGRRRALLAGSDGMAEIGRKGALKYWANMTPEEKRVEVRRRVAIRKENRRKRLRKVLGQA